MASISSVGIGSGVLTSDLIDKLAEAERAPTEARLDAKEADINAELSAFGQIQSALTELRLPARSLADPNLFTAKTVTSGNSAFSATATTSASTGSYSLEVTALAKAQALTSAEFNDADTTQIGTGTLAITAGSTSANITIDSSNNTLNGIAAAVNADSSLGVNASVLYTGTGYKLVFNAASTGLANTIDVAVTDTGDGNNTDNAGLSRLSYTTGAQNMTESQPATDAAFKLNGVAVTRSSNTVTDAVTGLTITLSGTNSGSPASLSVTEDTATIVDKVQTFVDKYNALQQLVTDFTAFDPTGTTDTGVLLGDSSTRSIMSQVQGILGTPVSGLSGATVTSLSEVGISTDANTGQLLFDQSTFTSKFTANAEDVTALFADQGRTTDSQVTYGGASANTVPGTYAVEVTTAATRGDVTGTVSLGASTLIDANNNDLTVKIDGTTSGAITLTSGSYSREQLAAEIQTQINADSTLSAAGKSVVVSIDASNQIVINSSIYGAASKVEVTAVDTNTTAQLGLSVGTGTDGVDIVGKINGVAATGSGQLLTGATGDDSEGIKLTVAGSATGSRGNVTYIEGVGEQLVDRITSFLGSEGTVTAKNDRLNSELQQIADDRASLDERVQSLIDRLTRQFTAADIIIAQLNSTQDFIQGQLDALAGTSSSSK